MAFTDLKKSILKWVFTVGIIAVGLFILRHVATPYWPAIAAAFAIPLGILWTPWLGEVVANFIGGFYTGGSQEVELKPLYSAAQSQRNRGLYREAIQSVREQLEQFPDDFTGMMLIATIQAENMNDLQGAKVTLEELLAVPDLHPQAASLALHALADWNLKYNHNPEAARAALQRIIDNSPGTQLSQIAAQRIAHIPTSEQLAPRGPIHLPAGQKNIGLQTTSQPMLAEAEPAAIAAGYVEQLEKFPLDSETREKLALLYAEQFKRPDLAVDELQQLIDQPNIKPAAISRWLDMLATVHLCHRNDLAAAEKTLRQIMQRFPNSAAAELANNRIFTLKSELRALDNPNVKKMGVYEKNLGLKHI